jgi:hypothetical protein
MKKMIVGIVIVVGFVALAWDEQKRHVSGAVGVGAVVADTRPCEQRGPGIVTGAGGACFDTVRAAENLKEAIAGEKKRVADAAKPSGFAGDVKRAFIDDCGYQIKRQRDARRAYEKGGVLTGRPMPRQIMDLISATSDREKACR